MGEGMYACISHLKISIGSLILALLMLSVFEICKERFTKHQSRGGVYMSLYATSRDRVAEAWGRAARRASGSESWGPAH